MKIKAFNKADVVFRRVSLRSRASDAVNHKAFNRNKFDYREE